MTSTAGLPPIRSISMAVTVAVAAALAALVPVKASLTIPTTRTLSPPRCHAV
jgi:hypothetical protein